MVLRQLEKFVSRFSSTLGVAISNLGSTGRTKKQTIAISVDVVLVIASLWLAFSLRYGEPFSSFKPNLHIFIALPIVTALILASLGVYKWVIRSSNERLTNTIIKGGLASSIALLMLMYLFPPVGSAPRSLFAVYGLIFTTASITARQLWIHVFGVGSASNAGERVAIYGAGRAGQQLVQLMKLDSSKNPVLFIDDNKAIARSTIAGLPVIPSENQIIEQQIQYRDISKIVIAIPSLEGDRYKQILHELSTFELPIQTIPNVSQIISGLASADQIRDISLADLLGRSVVEPDLELMRKRVTNKVVLVTGGGGSIGSEICRQVSLLGPKLLIVLDQSEENLYAITEEMRSSIHLSSPGKFLPVLGSVTNEEKLEKLFTDNAISTVYHAAAYKHVPIIEDYPEEAIDVNVFGTWKVLDCATRHNVEAFTLISTDKAVRPTSKMGATKRLAEMILQAKAKTPSNTVICMVRFGNVLGSSGSVVPKFNQQIASGGPITITHKEITRYFMTIPEASQLVIQASSLATGGEVFVLDMGEPVKIYDLAVSMIKLSGRQVASVQNRPGTIQIQEIGLRPGEKMYEELFVTEGSAKTAVSKIFVALDEQNYPELITDIVNQQVDPDLLKFSARSCLKLLLKPEAVNSVHIVESSSKAPSQ